jgi:hypothetical protein
LSATRESIPLVALPAFLQKILDSLHAGYPTEVPPQDSYPLLAFVARDLTSDDVTPPLTPYEPPT